MTLAIGHHYSIGGNKTGSGAFIDRLNAAGIPVMMKGASDAGLCFEAQEKGKQYGVENILIWRATSDREDRADYWLAPSVAAAKKWEEIQNLWPPELDKNLVWWEVINEPRKQDSENEEQPTWGNMHTTAWLGLFMVEMAKLMIPAGYKLCGPSFSSGEPEPEDWQLEGMASWLRYCADNPTKAAISHHEYCYPGLVPFEENYPWHYGRFQSIIAAADKLGIPRTFSIFLTEFGWTFQTVPSFETAVPTLTEYMKLGAKFPQLKGVALWTLQSGWGDISNQLAAWISNDGNPLANWIINNQYPELPQPQATAAEFGATLPNEEPDMKHKAIVVKLPQDMTATEWNEAAAAAFQFRHTMTASHDDMLTVLNGGNDESYVKFSHPERDSEAVALVEAAGYTWQPLYDNQPPVTEIIDIVDELPKHATKKYALRLPTDITTLTIHHTVSPPDRSIESIAAYHVNSNDWPGIGYHFVLKDDGRICQTNYLTTKSYHAGSSAAPGDENAISVGIALQGDFTNVPPPQAQLDAARQLVAYLRGELVNVTDVLGHRQMPGASTACPGATWQQWLPYVTGEIDNPLPPPVVIPPPAPVLVDVAPYFIPDGQYGRKIVIKTGNGTQPMQLEKRPSDVILRKGDGNWIDGVRYQDSEQWKVEDGQIQKGRDTSDAGNGGRDGYDLGWAQWIPQFVEVGKTYHSTPMVKRFNRTNNCQVYSESQANDYLTIKAVIPTWISPANIDIVLNDVLVIEWRSGTSDLSVSPNETYYFAKNIGYCGWGSHFIVEIADGQAPLTGKLDCGM